MKAFSCPADISFFIDGYKNTQLMKGEKIGHFVSYDLNQIALCNETFNIEHPTEPHTTRQ